MNKIDKVINYFRRLNESAPVMTSSPTMSTSTPNGSPGFSSSADSSGPNAGFDGVLKFMRRKKNSKIDYRSIPKDYKKWVKDLENK
jgi:hypothetical protein